MESTKAIIPAEVRGFIEQQKPKTPPNNKYFQTPFKVTIIVSFLIHPIMDSKNKHDRPEAPVRLISCLKDPIIIPFPIKVR